MNIDKWLDECVVRNPNSFCRISGLYANFKRWLSCQRDMSSAIGVPAIGGAFPKQSELRDALSATGYLRSEKYGVFVGIETRDT
jgi:hypothetical protein